MPANIFFMLCIFHFRDKVLIVHQKSTKVLKSSVIWDVTLFSLADVSVVEEPATSIFRDISVVEEPATSIFRTEKTTPTLKMGVTGFSEH